MFLFHPILRYVIIIVCNMESKDVLRFNKRRTMQSITSFLSENSSVPPYCFRFRPRSPSPSRQNEISSAGLQQITESTLNHASKLMLHRAENYKWLNRTICNWQPLWSTLCNWTLRSKLLKFTMIVNLHMSSANSARQVL